MGIAEDYFLALAPDPTEEQLQKIRRVLLGVTSPGTVDRTVRGINSAGQVRPRVRELGGARAGFKASCGTGFPAGNLSRPRRQAKSCGKRGKTGDLLRLWRSRGVLTPIARFRTQKTASPCRTLFELSGPGFGRKNLLLVIPSSLSKRAGAIGSERERKGAITNACYERGSEREQKGEIRSNAPCRLLLLAPFRSRCTFRHSRPVSRP